MTGWRCYIAVCLFAVCAALQFAACSDEPPGALEPGTLILATTTSLNDSGLLDVLAPIFEAEHDVDVKIIAVGTGAALLMGRQGVADVLLVHAPASEQLLVENGDVSSRVLIAYNDFVIVGPESDPAGVAGMNDAAAALARIAAAQAPFVTRGDDSGTQKKELTLWAAAGLQPDGEWYLDAGQGMAATLNVTDQRAAYTLTDRGTFLAHSQRLDLTVLVEGRRAAAEFLQRAAGRGREGPGQRRAGSGLGELPDARRHPAADRRVPARGVRALAVHPGGHRQRGGDHSARRSAAAIAADGSMTAPS